MKRHFLLGPAHLHAAHRTSVAIADCPHARAIPSVSANDKRHDQDDRDAPQPRQTCTARMIVFIVQFHRTARSKAHAIALTQLLKIRVFRDVLYLFHQDESCSQAAFGAGRKRRLHAEPQLFRVRMLSVIRPPDAGNRDHFPATKGNLAGLLSGLFRQHGFKSSQKCATSSRVD